MILLSVVTVVVPYSVVNFVSAVAGLLACAAVFLLLPDVRRLLMIQAFVLIFIGVALMLVAQHRGEAVSWLNAISRNTSLLSMVVAVGLLRLVMLDFASLHRPLPTGKNAFAQTIMAVGVFGSIINISGPIVIADRLTVSKPLDLFTAAGLTRTFSACAAWSPFFGGMAVVLVYTQSASVWVMMMHGLPFTIIAFFVVYTLGVMCQPDKVKSFIGYPVTPQSLWAPAVMSVVVLVAYRALPDIPILAIITATSVLLPLMYLLIRRGVPVARERFNQHISGDFCKSQNELLLFMAAGILASGLSSYLSTVDIALPEISFGAVEASILLAVMIVVAAIGIHSVIQIAVLTPLLQPLSPPADLLGMVYLFSWSLGTCASPLSGTHLVVQGRYGIASWRGALQNWPYVGIMYWVAVAILYWLSFSA